MVDKSRPLSFNQCPKCGGALNVDTHSMTGTKWKEYMCMACGWTEDVDLGTATWKALEDAAEPEEESNKE